jgi:TolB-like protein
VAPERSITPQTGRRMDRMIIVVLVLALGYFAFDKFVLTPRREAARVSSAVPNESKSVIDAKSIAVLPFENLSEKKANAFFTEGVQHQILTNLAQIADLKVISRTSVMQYKSGAPRNLREIGQQLGVAHVVEGSVQRAANKVRVIAQLIDARNDAHLWAQTYEAIWPMSSPSKARSPKPSPAIRASKRWCKKFCRKNSELWKFLFRTKAAPLTKNQISGNLAANEDYS